MVDVKSAAAGALIATLVARAVNSTIDNGDDSNGDNGSDGGGSGDNGGTNGDVIDMEKLDELVNIQRRQYGDGDSIDAYVGEVLDLSDGAVGTVTVTPREGFNLHVKSVYFDRRSDHDYSHRIDGAEVSDNHQAQFRSSRITKHGGKIVGEVTNNSGSSTTVDYELEGWSNPT